MTSRMGALSRTSLSFSSGIIDTCNSLLRTYPRQLPACDTFPARGDAGTGRRERLCRLGTGDGVLPLVRNRLGGPEVQDHTEYEAPPEKAEPDNAKPVDPAQQHDLKDDGEQMTEEKKEDAEQHEDEKKRERLCYLRREVDEDPYSLAEKGIVSEGGPATRDKA